MKNLQKIKKILKKEIQMYFRQELQYRDLLIARILTDIIRIFTVCFVWLSVGGNSGGVSQGYIVTYYLLTVFVTRLMSDFSIQKGPSDVITGKFSKYIIKPYSHLVEYLGINVGYSVLRFVLALPAFILGIFLVGDLWVLDFNPYTIFLSVLAMVLGFFMNFLLGNLFTFFAFFSKQVHGLRIFYFNVASVFSGELIPLVFMSYNMRFLSELLPFRYTLSFPIEILIGDLTGYDLRRGFLISTIWIVFLFVSYNFLYKKVVRKYEAEGI